MSDEDMGMHPCDVCGHDVTDRDHDVSHMQYVRGREQFMAAGGRPEPQMVKLDPVILSPESGVVALADGEELTTIWDPRKILDLEAMDQQLIEAGIAVDVRQGALKQAAEAQIQFLAMQLSTITWFLEYESLDLPRPETERPTNKHQLHPYDPTHLRLKTVAYDHGRMEVTFRLGALDDAPEGQTQESEADEAATAEPSPDEDGPPVQQPRDVAAGSESRTIR